jgi:hypothetical protein
MLELPDPPKILEIPSLRAAAPRVTEVVPVRERTSIPLKFANPSLMTELPLTATVSIAVPPVTLLRAKFRPFRIKLVAVFAPPTR